MITHRTIGHQGRLGNQMFQYASTIGIAKKNNYAYCFDLSNTKLKNYFNITTNECKLIGVKNNITSIAIDNEYYYLNDRWEEGDATKFNAGLFDNSDYCSYHGYLQSHKYFEHCIDFIKKEFTFRHQYEWIDSIFNNQDYNAIHVRRTDYLKNPDYHNVLSIEWYKNAIEHMGDPGARYIVFSDDKDWCKENFLSNNIIVSPFMSEIEDLYAMSLCKNHIISNSTFAWWGCWLSKNNGKVIAPQQWFATNGPKHWKDIYLDNWIIL